LLACLARGPFVGSLPVLRHPRKPALNF